MDLVRKNQSSIGLSDADISNAIVSDTYVNKTSGTRLVYLQQTYLGIPVYNQIHVLSFKNGKLVYQSGGRISSMDKRSTTVMGFLPFMQKRLFMRHWPTESYFHQSCNGVS